MEGFTRKGTDGPGRGFRSLTEEWSSQESLSPATLAPAETCTHQQHLSGTGTSHTTSGWGGRNGGGRCGQGGWSGGGGQRPERWPLGSQVPTAAGLRSHVLPGAAHAPGSPQAGGEMRASLTPASRSEPKPRPSPSGSSVRCGRWFQISRVPGVQSYFPTPAGCLPLARCPSCQLLWQRQRAHSSKGSAAHRGSALN